MAIEHPEVSVGGLDRAALMSALDAAGVQFNASATTLLAAEQFADSPVEMTRPIEISVQELGFTDGASLSQVIAAADEHGLSLLPLIAAPYLRLALLDQADAPDSILSAGRVPTGSITIASARPRPDDDAYPSGFYLRVVDGIRWLRGYRSTNDAIWPASAHLMFQRGAPQS